MTSWPNIPKGLRKGMKTPARRPRPPITWEKVRRCRIAHPSYGRQVLCEELKGHSGDHFHSFYMRSWEA